MVCPSMAIRVYPDDKKVEYHSFKCLFCFLCIDNCMQLAISNSTTVPKPGFEKRIEIFETKKD